MLDAHTPGPWEQEVTADGNHYVASRSLDVALAFDSDAGTLEEIPAQANAQLIAAAPKLLAACREAVQCLENLSEADYQRLKADDLAFRLNEAIAKAILPGEEART